jgi:hypothetical protein
MDLSALYAALTVPAGAHLVSDHGQVALLVVTHANPNQATIERVPLGACVPLEEALRSAYHAGALPSQQLPMPAIEITTIEPPQLTGANGHQEAEQRKPCRYGCGKLLVPKKGNKHYYSCPNKPQEPATQEQPQAAQEEPCSDPS